MGKARPSGAQVGVAGDPNARREAGGIGRLSIEEVGRPRVRELISEQGHEQEV